MLADEKEHIFTSDILNMFDKLRPLVSKDMRKLSKSYCIIVVCT